jgi:hypothetical protein
MITGSVLHACDFIKILYVLSTVLLIRAGNGYWKCVRYFMSCLKLFVQQVMVTESVLPACEFIFCS